MARQGLRACAVVVVLTAMWSSVAAQSAPIPLTIAAASDLQAVMPELVSRFEREAGVPARVSFGSSGNFFAQIQNGAPFDLFFSADIDYPLRLIAAGHADRATLTPYATGRLVLWARKSTGIDVRRGLAILTDSRVRRIAIANPEHAPYGRAAVAALRAAQLHDALKAKLVLGENISQTAQLADSGNADVAFIALSLALGPALRASGVYQEIPASTHPPIEQAAVVVSASTHKAAASRFLKFVSRPDVQQLLQRNGFAAAAARRER
jgi:molybdate transport system substrate-binding protein